MALLDGKQIRDGSIADAKLTTSYIKADGTRAFTGPQSMGGFKLTSVATPTVGTDAVNKDYVDGAISGKWTGADKGLTAQVTSSDGDAALAAGISATPNLDGYVEVNVNGIQYLLGDGGKTKDCYFSNDGGTTARSLAAIVSGDTLHWNGTIANFELATTDIIDLNYNAA